MSNDPTGASPARRWRTWHAGALGGASVRLVLLALYVAAVYGVVVYVVEALWPTAPVASRIFLLLCAAILSVVGVGVIDRRLDVALPRLLGRRRTTPYDAVAALSAWLTTARPIDTAMATLARILADGTGAATASVWLSVDDRLVLAATWPADVPAESVTGVPDLLGRSDVDHAVEVRDTGDTLGALAIGKPPGEFLTPMDERLVGDIGNSAGLLLRNARLAAELTERVRELSTQEAQLRASRRRLVRARDTTRRRLADDISVTVRRNLAQLRTRLPRLRDELGAEPDQAAKTLAGLQDDADQLVARLRTIVHGVYPPVLRNHGLRAALDALATTLPWPTEVDADDVGRYLPDIEATIYFCAATLARLRSVGDHETVLRLRLRADQHELHLSVHDARASEAPTVPADALADVVDRLATLGGTLDVSYVDGVVTHARLPLGDTDHESDRMAGVL
jgi:signal transduction histidine kinase